MLAPPGGEVRSKNPQLESQGRGSCQSGKGIRSRGAQGAPPPGGLLKGKLKGNLIMCQKSRESTGGSRGEGAG